MIESFHPINQEHPFIDSHDNESADNGLKLWMERGFSRREIAQYMMQAVPDLTIYTSHNQPMPGVESIEYPSFSKEPDAVDKLNQRIAEHDIDILWPQNSAQYDLSRVNAEVHTAASPEVIALVDDKAWFNEWLGDNDPMKPDATEVLGVEGVAEEYARRRAENRETCVKPIIGVFGQGYWRLTEDTYASLINWPERRKIHPDIYLAALALEEAKKGPQRLLVMDYFPGPEVSVDLLCWRGIPLAHAARTKIEDTNDQRVQSEHPVVEHVYDVAARLALHGIVSLQYRLDYNQDWKMLEINPRPAGGSINSEAAGFGLIANWAILVAGKAGPDDVKQVEGDVKVEFTEVAKITPQ